MRFDLSLRRLAVVLLAVSDRLEDRAGYTLTFSPVFGKGPLRATLHRQNQREECDQHQELPG